MRIKHNYRNISRATKQFMMGDKLQEQLMVLTLRDQYYRPNAFQAPIEQTYFLGRALADLTDRHYSLFANNQHPIQLACYHSYNEMLRGLHDEDVVKEQMADGEELDRNYSEAQSVLNNDEGENLSIDELAEVYYQTRGA